LVCEPKAGPSSADFSGVENTKAARVGRLLGSCYGCTILGRREIPAIPKS
jgi:hypothetical protein